MQNWMVPKTADEMVRMSSGLATLMLYVDITRAARKGQLDEAQIDEIERRIRIEIGKERKNIGRYPFDVEKAILQAEAIFDEHCKIARDARRTD